MITFSILAEYCRKLLKYLKIFKNISSKSLNFVYTEQKLTKFFLECSEFFLVKRNLDKIQAHVKIVIKCF